MKVGNIIDPPDTRMLSIKSTLDPENARTLDVEIREILEQDSQESVVVVEPKCNIFNKEQESAKSSTQIVADSYAYITADVMAKGAPTTHNMANN